MALPFDFLLPNLRRIMCATDPQVLPYFRLLQVGPNITDIHLQLMGPTSRLAMLPVLARYPRLSSLTVSFANHHNSTPEAGRSKAISCMIHLLVDIRSISVGCMDAAACQHLASFPNLTFLGIDEVEEPLLPVYSISLSDPIFPSLKSLRIRTSSANLATDFLTAVSKSPLQVLEISLVSMALASEAPILLQAIALSWPSLTSLDVDLGTWNGLVAGAEAYTVVLSTLAPLLLLHNIVNLIIYFPLALGLTDACMADMASAWPSLERFCLWRLLETTYMRPPIPGSKLTLSSLLSFAHHCPFLRQISLPFANADVPACDLTQTEPHTKQTALRSLGVVQTPLAEGAPPAVTTFLASVFPALVRIPTDGEDYHWLRTDDSSPRGQWHRRWKEVQRLVPLLMAGGQEKG
ncbi:hypothetical protein C8R43DRAFT_1241234 [Mycena crocata]|nr:hypothetical protein C8R43DRAFT_1241234 [Mycena crocata]